VTNVSVNTGNIVARYAAKVIALAEKMEVFRPLVGKSGDKDAFCYRPGDEHQKGKTWAVPLRNVITTAALEDGATYEAQAQPIIYSTTTITANERGQVFGGFTDWEEMQTLVNLREDHADEAGSWYAQDFDGKAFSQLQLAVTTLPSLADSKLAATQYNVHYCGSPTGWDTIDAGCKITPTEISKAKRFMQAKRRIRPAKISPGRFGYILILPTEATLDLQVHGDFQKALANALPRDEDHVFFKGRGLNPWGYWDGVYICEDMRPVYGGTDGTFLLTDLTSLAEAGLIKYEGIFLGAQGFAYAEWKPISWFERVYDHGRKFEMSVHSTYGFIKTVMQTGAIAGTTYRDYGIGYFCGAATAIA
jgi:hypothetical protein